MHYSQKPAGALPVATIRTAIRLYQYRSKHQLSYPTTMVKPYQFHNQAPAPSILAQLNCPTAKGLKSRKGRHSEGCICDGEPLDGAANLGREGPATHQQLMTYAPSVRAQHQNNSDVLDAPNRSIGFGHPQEVPLGSAPWQAFLVFFDLCRG